MNVVQVNPAVDPLWQQLVMNYDSSVFHSPQWHQVLASSYDWQPTAQVLVDDDQCPQAGLSYIAVDDFRGKRIVSLPFTDYLDPLVRDADQWETLLNAANVDGCPIFMRCLHSEIPVEDERFTTFKQAKWHQIDLHPDTETLWMNIDPSARRAIRKGQQSGVTIEITSDKESLEKFFNLHLGIRKYKYRLLPQPYAFFEHIWEQFFAQDKGALVIASYEGRPVGSTLFLEWKDTLFYKFSASDLQELAVRPTDMIIWEAIQYAKSRGLAYFDFGLSDWDQEGLLRFKRKYATTEKTISFLRHGSLAAPTQIQQVMSLFGRLTELLTDDTVPDAVTARAGDALYRFFV